MKKYSEIKLTDDERKLLEVLKSQGYESIGKELYPGEECHSNIFGRTRRVQNFLLLDWFDGFDWMDYNDEYEIEKLLNPPHEPKTVWELGKSDKYWVLNEYGNVIEYTWRDDDVDKKLRRQGNAFLTEEEAEFEAKRREVVTKVRKYARPFKRGRNQYIPCYDHNSEKIGKYCVGFNQENVDHFDTQEDIYKAIEEVGEEDFKKYYLGVKDEY